MLAKQYKFVPVASLEFGVFGACHMNPDIVATVVHLERAADT